MVKIWSFVHLSQNKAKHSFKKDGAPRAAFSKTFSNSKKQQKVV